jgi:hypothetical protein
MKNENKENNKENKNILSSKAQGDFFESIPVSESPSGLPEDSASRKGDRSLLFPGSTGRSTQLSYFMVTLTGGMDDFFESIPIAETPAELGEVLPELKSENKPKTIIS